jgi:hypothetical protein
MPAFGSERGGREESGCAMRVTHLDLASVGEMRAHAQVNQWTTLVHCGLRSIGNLILDQIDLRPREDKRGKQSERGQE